MNKKGHVLNGILLAVGLALILNAEALIDGVTLAEAQTTAVTVAELFIPVTLGALFPDVDTAFGKHRKTLHNLPVLGIFLAYPFFFGNLQYVWIGVATHYVLDIVGSRRGIALFYPLSSTEYGFPTGVTTSSKYADVVTVVATIIELGILAAFHLYVFPLDAGFGSAVTAFGV